MRYLVSIALALVVSLGLFWGMDKLVNKERHELTSDEDLRMVDFIHVKQNEKIQEKKRELPKPPPPPKRPPPPPEMKVTATVKPVMEQMLMDTPQLDLPVNVTGGSVLGHYSQGGGAQAVGGNNGPIPLATFQPSMPRKAARSGLEKGIVLLEFVVNERCAVENVKVLKETPRKLGLGKAAKKTVSKWTFKPKMVDGKPASAKMSQEIEFSTN